MAGHLPAAHNRHGCIAASRDRGEGRVHPEDRVHHAERVLDQRIPRLADAVADQLEESRVHNVLARIRGGRSGRLVSQLHDPVVGVLIRLGVVGRRGMNANEVTANVRNQRPIRGHGPRFEVRFQEVGVFLEILGCGLMAPLAREGRGTEQGGNVSGQGTRASSRVFLPAFLRSDRPWWMRAGRFSTIG